MLNIAEQSWPGITGLGEWCDRSAFKKAEPQCGHGRDDLGVLVESCGQPDGIPEPDTETFLRQSRVINAVSISDPGEDGGEVIEGFQARQRQVVRSFRIQSEQEAAEKPV